MNSRDRIEAVLNFREADRVPIIDWIQHSGVVAHYAGVPERKNEWTWEEAARAASNALDMTQDIIGSYEPGVYVDEEGFKWQSDFWTKWIVEKPFHDIESLTDYVEKKIRDIEREIEDKDWNKEMDTFRSEFLSGQKLLGDTLRMYVVNVGLEEAYNLAGMEMFIYLYAENPELVSRWVEALNRKAVAYVNHFVDRKLSPMVLIHSDIAADRGLIFSPSFLKKELIPRVAVLTEACHRQGVKVIYHSEGYIMDILDDLIAAGIDGINPLEPGSNMQLEVVRAKYPKLILWGGIDNLQLLPHGTIDEVKVAVKKAIDQCAQGGGLLLGSSGQIHPACKLENCIAMIETIKEYGVR